MKLYPFILSTALFTTGLPLFAQHDDHDHAAHDDHGAHDGPPVHEEEGDHEAHGHDAEADDVDLSPEVLREFGVRAHTAGPAKLEETVHLTGEVVYDRDRVAHVTPAVAGRVHSVHASVGDEVNAGQVLAVLESRELAEARGAYLAARARVGLAEETQKRDQRLFEEKIGSERAALESRQALREARIALTQTKNALFALGYDRTDVEQIDQLKEEHLNRYDLRSPIRGRITERHLTPGEIVEAGNEPPFVVADLSTIWVNLAIYPRDLPRMKAGQNATVRFGHGLPEGRGPVAFVSPALREDTRTAFARVVLDNPDGNRRPGLFVNATVETGHGDADVAVPPSALTRIDDRDTVFVRTENGWRPRAVKTGHRSEHAVEIVEGLHAGETVATGNVMTLKAERNRGAMEHAGHAH